MKFSKKHMEVFGLKNKKLLLVLAMVVFAAFVVAGCGSTNTESKKDTAPSEKKAETTGLMQTFQKSVHYTFFGDMIAKGPSIKDEKGEHYGDTCMNCHTAAKMIDDKNAKVDDFLPNGKYADKVEGITCRVCHELGGKEGIELKKKGWDTCGQCHIPGTNPDGTIRQPAIGGEVHHPQLIFIQGMEIKGGEVPKTESKIMTAHSSVEGYGCQSCHVMNETNHSFMVPGVSVVSRKGFGRDKVDVDYNKMKTIFDQKKCQTCHSSNAQQVVDTIKKNQQEIGKQLEALKATSEELAKNLKASLNGPDGKPLKYAAVTDPKAKAYLEGMSYFSYVEADSSKGAHNYEYAKALLAKADEKFKAAK